MSLNKELPSDQRQRQVVIEAIADTAPVVDWIEETDGDMPVLICVHCRAVIRFTVNADSELMRRAMGEHRCETGGER